MKKINIKRNPKIETKDRFGEINGYLIPIFSVHEAFIAKEQHPKQVYLTVVKPKKVKGPHLHLKRWGLFTCIKGNIKIIIKTNKAFEEFFSGEDHDYATIQIPAGTPAALENIGNEDAFVLNMPSPAWRIDAQDEHPVSFDDYFKFDDKENL